MTVLLGCSKMSSKYTYKLTIIKMNILNFVSTNELPSIQHILSLLI